jgi:hypothetical protein
MADLEDFFAKRDKKKKTKGQKFETTGLDDVAKILDAKVKERKKQETNKSTYQVPASDSTDQTSTDYRAQEDDEWKEIVEEKPDYTGLKIQELVLEDEEENGKDGGGEEDGDKPQEGPWRKDRKPAPTPAAPVPTPVEETPESIESPIPASEDKPTSQVQVETPTSEAAPPVPAVEEPKKGGYVPPAVRKAREEEAAKNAALAAATAAASTITRPIASSVTSDSSAPAPKLASTSGGSYVPPSKRGGVPSSTVATKPRKNVPAPNINDEHYFPSLGEALKHS